jgi:hypothetical protein
MVAYEEPSHDLEGLDSLHANVSVSFPSPITHVTNLHELVGDLEKHRTSPHQPMEKQSFLLGLLGSEGSDTEL